MAAHFAESMPGWWEMKQTCHGVQSLDVARKHNATMEAGRSVKVTAVDG
jgi:hypothetical protein